jgi:hypothetical protein
VTIPQVVANSVEFVRVIQEIEPADAADPRHDPFLLTSQHRGLVALRINYPYQSASMSGFQPNPNGPYEPTIGHPIVADDAALNVANPPGVLASSDHEYGPYAGPYGLGRQAALGSTELTGGQPVRPFRRLISAQAIARREIITP